MDCVEFFGVLSVLLLGFLFSLAVLFLFFFLPQPQYQFQQLLNMILSNRIHDNAAGLASRSINNQTLITLTRY